MGLEYISRIRKPYAANKSVGRWIILLLLLDMMYDYRHFTQISLHSVHMWYSWDEGDQDEDDEEVGGVERDARQIGRFSFHIRAARKGREPKINRFRNSTLATRHHRIDSDKTCRTISLHFEYYHRHNDAQHLINKWETNSIYIPMMLVCITSIYKRIITWD